MKHKMLEFASKGPTQDKKDKTDIIDHGKLGGLDYKVYKRGSIHITDGKRTFHKDIDAFEDAIKTLDIDNMENGDTRIVEGSGDTDHIVFHMEDGDLSVRITKRGFDVLEKLKGILNKGRAKKEAV